MISPTVYLCQPVQPCMCMWLHFSRRVYTAPTPNPRWPRATHKSIFHYANIHCHLSNRYAEKSKNLISWTTEVAPILSLPRIELRAQPSFSKLFQPWLTTVVPPTRWVWCECCSTLPRISLRGSVCILSRCSWMSLLPFIPSEHW